MTNEKHALSVIVDMIGKQGSIFLKDSGLTALPPEIGKLAEIRGLHLSGNQLTDLPREFSGLIRLSTLDLSDNQLTAIPKEITQLTNLASLYLSNNNITNLPEAIKNLYNLKELDLRGNPLPIPPEILSKTKEPERILNFYFSIVDESKKPRSNLSELNETKVLFVGQGSVGKTSLIGRLIMGRYIAETNKTEGIVINKCFIENEKFSTDLHSTTGDQPNQIKLNIWDFGGQEIMHATHQFFLTKRSLYLLVLDARLTQEENRVEYWLKIMNSFSDGSPVLIVGNKIDQHPLDIDRTGLQRKYPNIVGILETSAATGAGIEELKSTIITQVYSLPHVRDLLPDTWFTIKNRLEEIGRRQNFITHDAYQNLCIEFDIQDKTSQSTLIGFLHDLGIILYFQDHARLETLGILNPQWVTNGVYKIINSHTLFHNQGTLTMDMLNDILNLPDYPRGKRLFIVDIMRKFELCYDIKPDYTFLVPDLLSRDEPFTGDWSGALAFQYHYNILPSSIISRFIVRMHPFIYKTVWRSGVVLKKGNNTALVKADIEDRKIYIWISGDEDKRRDFLSAIRLEFDAIHKTIAKIEAREKVPVRNYPDVAIDYQHLLKLERKGITEYIPEGLDNPVFVQHLLDGVTTPDQRMQDLVNFNGDAIRTRPQPTTPISADVSEDNKSVPLRILTVIFLSFPKIIGRAILDAIGRANAADSTGIILGYLSVLLSVLLLLGIIDINALIDTFKNTWRFFFPLK